MTRGIDNSYANDVTLHTAAKILCKFGFPIEQARSSVIGIATDQQGSSHSSSPANRAEAIAHRLITGDELKDELLKIAAELTAIAQDAVPGSPNIPRFTRTRELMTRLEATLQMSTRSAIELPNDRTLPEPEL